MISLAFNMVSVPTGPVGLVTALYVRRVVNEHFRGVAACVVVKDKRMGREVSVSVGYKRDSGLSRLGVWQPTR